MKLTKNIKLNPNTEQTLYLSDTTNLYIKTVNELLTSFNNGNNTKITSKDVDASLPSCLKNNCINDAKSIYKKYKKDLKKDDNKKLPTLKKKIAIWNNQNYKINYNDNFISFPVWINNKSTIIKVHAELINIDKLKTNKLGTMRILLKNNKWYAQISYHEEEMINGDTVNIMGIDLGLKVPAVCVSGTGNTKFIGNGRKNKYLRRYNNIRRKKLGSLKKINAIKKSKDKERRVMSDIDHKISRKVVNFAVKEKVEIIRLEKLANISKATRTSRKNNQNLHSWAFYRMQKYIEYKASLVGIKVDYVDPHNTSKMCPCCGKLNKTKTRNYKCKCGYQGHRDRVGALNIRNSFNFKNVPELYGKSIVA